MRERGCLGAVLLCAALRSAASAPPTEAALDARVHALSDQLRCLVCQNQTLADSNAELAVDLRRQIREQLRAGASDEAIKTYLVQRYGDFVLYQPPLKPVTWLLWFGPPLLLGVTALRVARMLARRRADGSVPLDDNERERLHAILHPPPEEPPR